jgi:hypothetical protein
MTNKSDFQNLEQYLEQVFLGSSAVPSPTWFPFYFTQVKENSLHKIDTTDWTEPSPKSGMLTDWITSTWRYYSEFDQIDQFDQFKMYNN